MRAAHAHPPLPPCCPPQFKAETDQYLRELEQQGRASEVVGSGTTLIVPEPGVALKTREAAPGGARVYINLCTSDKLQPFSQRASEQGGRQGVHVEVPVSLGPAKKVGAMCDRRQRTPGRGHWRPQGTVTGHCGSLMLLVGPRTAAPDLLPHPPCQQAGQRCFSRCITHCTRRCCPGCRCRVTRRAGACGMLWCTPPPWAWPWPTRPSGTCSSKW